MSAEEGSEGEEETDPKVWRGGQIELKRLAILDGEK